MGYQNNNNKNNQQKKKLPRLNNPDPMSNYRTMAREGMRIIKDIAFGKFNFYNEGHIFRNPEFIKATLTEVDVRLLEADIHVKSIECAYAGCNDPSVLKVLNRDKRTYEAYVMIRNALTSTLMNNDTGFIMILINKLPDYKYNI